jgi:mono/diheme cytochrome c family protein
MRATYVGIVFLLAAGIASAADQASTEFFEARIRPVLSANCFACHTTSKLGGLRVDSRVALMEGGKSGPAIVIGQPDDSLLIRAVSQVDPKLKMPMAGNKLKDNEIADLKYWIKIGAPWPDAPRAKVEPAANKFTIRPEQRAFWSFQPLQKPAVPAVKDKLWAKGPIDYFILAKLEEQGLKPVPPADKRTLLRRVYYDLIGLPPTPEQVSAFLADNSPDAYEKVVDSLLASPHYGERWGRHWLDVSRYFDGAGRGGRGGGGMVFLGYGMDKDGYANTWRYRDWVVKAFNDDMPYDQFVKAQIAADLLPEKDRDKMLPALGMFGLGPWFTGDDIIYVEARADELDAKVDALTKGFLGLTVTCARCHNHKYDPISQKDYYSLAGVFASSGFWEYNLAPKAQVDAYRAQSAKISDLQASLRDFDDECAIRVAESLTTQIPDYLMAARRARFSRPAEAADSKLDKETLNRWIKYLAGEKEHPYLADWDALMARGGGSDAEALSVAEKFRAQVQAVIAEKKGVNAANRDMRRNYRPDPGEARVLLPGDLMQFELFQYKQKLVEKTVDKNTWYLWRDIIAGFGDFNRPRKDALLEYKGAGLDRFLTPEEKAKRDGMRAEGEALAKNLPPEYPYLMGLKDNATPTNVKINLRGSPHALGEPAPRGFPAILANTDGEPMPFTQGSGRLELAEAIVKQPLAARVIVNRVWMNHFGHGIVDSVTNFGVMGDRPSHPELLDYLATRLVASGWSIKQLQREIVTSGVYRLGVLHSEANAAKDPGNQYLWRANLQRLEAEELRDSLLFAAGTLDERPTGGPAEDMTNSKKRTLYVRSGRSADRLLQLFDFTGPALASEARSVTNVPQQALFFLNSDSMAKYVQMFTARLGVETAPQTEWSDKIRQAYSLLFQREPAQAELDMGLQFLKEAAAGAPKMPAWQQYTQVLLSSPEFYYVD